MPRREGNADGWFCDSILKRSPEINAGAISEGIGREKVPRELRKVSGQAEVLQPGPTASRV